MSVKTFKTEKQTGKRPEKKEKPEQTIQELWNNYRRYNIYITRIPEEERKEQGNIWKNNDLEFPQINFKH